uniref:Glycosyltransferase n=1 Tax=candidate division WOR-3 bacterium TaxID=2052148 RepID=A0A7C4YFR5_UNCW3
MKENLLCSIITPTYNHESFIGDCIKSVISQTYPFWEMIIIDDGSTDNTEKIIKRFTDKRIKYIKQKNKGIWKLKETYNKGLNYSKGELIAILEGDDFWPSDKLEKQVPLFEDKEIILSWGKVAYTDIDGKILKVFPPNPYLYKNMTQTEVIKMLLYQIFIPPCTVVIRKKALLSIGGFIQPEYFPAIDYPTFLELSLLGKFHFSDSILGYWRQHSNQITKKMSVYLANGFKYAEEKFKVLPEDLKKEMNIKLYELTNSHRIMIAYSYFCEGRVLQIKGIWDKAIEDFIISFKLGNYLTKIKSLLALVSSLMRIKLS